MAKMYQLGIRADARRRARWARKAKNAGMSLNKWAMAVLDSAPDVKPPVVYFDSAKAVR
jgi:predicted HicB family RNase H-like nuclease